MKLHNGKLALAVFVLAGLAGIAPMASARAVGPDVHSSPSEQVGEKLATLPFYGVFDNIQYQVNGTQVILSGQVTSEHSQTKYDAEKFVKGLEGVTSVVNNIQVLPPSPDDDVDLGDHTERIAPEIGHQWRPRRVGRNGAESDGPQRSGYRREYGAGSVLG